MKIKKGTIVEVNSHRAGKYTGIATADFDTDSDEWYEINVHQERPVEGISHIWENGKHIPCRKGLCTIKPKEGV
jgi:hypothetical protein